jgi:hypothetical protein
MTNQDYLAAAALYLGSNRHNAIAQGPRAFRRLANAVRFAIERHLP